MKVTAIDYTGAGSSDPASYAAAVLIFTKSTRLQMSPGLFERTMDMSYDEKLNELSYMANTIPSSWEFCHYTFMIEGVTRGFTHQLVRTRTASFAQQTMRVLNVDGWTYGTGPTIEANSGLKAVYEQQMRNIDQTYRQLIEDGAAIEDARGVLPTNIHTNIVMGCSLRTLVELIAKRSSPRTQGEYRNVLDGLKSEAMRVHPWTSLFFERTQQRAASDLDKEIQEIEDKDKRTRMIKLVDQLRNQ
jgi:flavin-dependent thymidylate synthase